MSHKRKRMGTDHVEPDLPITPMLDMSFQLMAFFILSFRPAPTEGQIALALPKDVGGGAGLPSPIEDEKPEELTAVVDASSDGQLRAIKITAGSGDTNVGADLNAYQKVLADKKNANKGKVAGKLKIEIDKQLLHEYVVQLIDIASRLDYTDISPEPQKTGK